MIAIRKHFKDVAAIIGLILVAGLVASVILSNQRLTLPGWVPVIGQDFYEIEAEMKTAQSVTPGQGQTVNIAGVEVGEIKSVKLEDGRAIHNFSLITEELGDKDDVVADFVVNSNAVFASPKRV